MANKFDARSKQAKLATEDDISEFVNKINILRKTKKFN